MCQDFERCLKEKKKIGRNQKEQTFYDIMRVLYIFYPNVLKPQANLKSKVYSLFNSGKIVLSHKQRAED